MVLRNKIWWVMQIIILLLADFQYAMQADIPLSNNYKEIKHQRRESGMMAKGKTENEVLMDAQKDGTDDLQSLEKIISRRLVEDLTERNSEPTLQRNKRGIGKFLRNIILQGVQVLKVINFVSVPVCSGLSLSGVLNCGYLHHDTCRKIEQLLRRFNILHEKWLNMIKIVEETREKKELVENLKFDLETIDSKITEVRFLSSKLIQRFKGVVNTTALLQFTNSSNYTTDSMQHLEIVKEFLKRERYPAYVVETLASTFTMIIDMIPSVKKSKSPYGFFFESKGRARSDMLAIFLENGPQWLITHDVNWETSSNSFEMSMKAGYAIISNVASSVCMLDNIELITKSLDLHKQIKKQERELNTGEAIYRNNTSILENDRVHANKAYTAQEESYEKLIGLFKATLVQRKKYDSIFDPTNKNATNINETSISESVQHMNSFLGEFADDLREAYYYIKTRAVVQKGAPQHAGVLEMVEDLNYISPQLETEYGVLVVLADVTDRDVYDGYPLNCIRKGSIRNQDELLHYLQEQNKITLLKYEYIIMLYFVTARLPPKEIGSLMSNVRHGNTENGEITTEDVLMIMAEENIHSTPALQNAFYTDQTKNIFYIDMNNQTYLLPKIEIHC